MDLGPGEERYVNLLRDCLTASLYDESGYTRLVHNSKWTWNLRWMLLGLVRGLLARRNLALYRTSNMDRAVRDGGKDWPAFGYTMIGTRRMDHLRRCIEDVIDRQVPGDLLEAGVWRGGAGIFMRAILRAHGVTDRTVWLADSFQGLPKPRHAMDRGKTEYDLSGMEYLAVSLAQVRSNFARFGLLDSQVQFLAGWFKDTLPDAPVRNLAILRADGDLYESTMDTLTSLYDRVSSGGYVIIDDYHAWKPARDAVHDFRAQRGISEPVRDIDDIGVYWQA